MFSAEAAIIIKQNKNNGEGDPALSYNGAKTATRKHYFKISTINGRAKGGKKKRNCRRADGERRKKMIDNYLKLFTNASYHFILQKL